MGFLRQLQLERLMNEAGDEGAEGGGSGSEKTPETFTPEQVQEAIQKALQDNTAKLKKEWAEDVAGLKQNRDDLKNEKLEAQKKLKDIELKQRMLDADEKTLEGIREEIRSSIKNEYEEQLNSTKTELDKLKESLNTKTIHTALDAKLNDLKVKSSFRNALKAQILLENKATVAEDGTVMIGDQSADSYFQEWQKSDGSKDFIVADRSSGGGSSGSGGSGHSNETDLLNLSGAELFSESFKQQASK